MVGGVTNSVASNVLSSSAPTGCDLHSHRQWRALQALHGRGGGSEVGKDLPVRVTYTGGIEMPCTVDGPTGAGAGAGADDVRGL